MIFFIFHFLLLINVAFCTVNNEVSQVFDATTSIVRYSAEIKAGYVEKEYEFLLSNRWAERLSFMSAVSKGRTLSILPAVSRGNYTSFSIVVDEPSPVLKVKAVFTEILSPFPREISQSEQQLVLLESQHYFLSPYPTVSQKSVFKLASSSVESFTKVTPHSIRGSSIHFGPFQNIPPFSFSELKIHFVNNFPFAKFSSLTREIEVSHWGNVAVEEIYELKHVGAHLKGGFSRFDYQMKRAAQSPSFRSLTGVLPRQASNIYYRDQIGNISTSDIRVDGDGNLELEVQTRFPLFGGWQTQFYIGYSIPTELVLFRDLSQRHTLKFDFFTIFKDVWIDELEIKVILPEGCQNIKVDVPYAVDESEAVRYTFLDSHLNGGRNVVVLKTKNIVEEHDKKIIVSYEFAKTRMLVEPFMIVGSCLLFFFACTFFSRVSTFSERSKIEKTD